MKGIHSKTCIDCGERFICTNETDCRCLRCELVLVERSHDYIAPECPIDLSVSIRQAIVDDVACKGETERCSHQMSNAFAGWNHDQIDAWCAEHRVIIIAYSDGRILIKSASSTRSLEEIRAEFN